MWCWLKVVRKLQICESRVLSFFDSEWAGLMLVVCYSFVLLWLSILERLDAQWKLNSQWCFIRGLSKTRRKVCVTPNRRLTNLAEILRTLVVDLTWGELCALQTTPRLSTKNACFSHENHRKYSRASGFSGNWTSKKSHWLEFLFCFWQHVGNQTCSCLSVLTLSPLCLSSAGSFSFCCLCSSLTSGPLNESRCEKEKNLFLLASSTRRKPSNLRLYLKHSGWTVSKKKSQKHWDFRGVEIPGRNSPLFNKNTSPIR
jgi:hypothetical protein